jgi:hypothetical protein
MFGWFHTSSFQGLYLFSTSDARTLQTACISNKRRVSLVLWLCKATQPVHQFVTLVNECHSLRDTMNIRWTEKHEPKLSPMNWIRLAGCRLSLTGPSRMGLVDKAKAGQDAKEPGDKGSMNVLLAQNCCFIHPELGCSLFV